MEQKGMKRTRMPSPYREETYDIVYAPAEFPQGELKRPTWLDKIRSYPANYMSIGPSYCNYKEYIGPNKVQPARDGAQMPQKKTTQEEPAKTSNMEQNLF